MYPLLRGEPPEHLQHRERLDARVEPRRASPRNASHNASGRRWRIMPVSERSPLVSAGVTCLPGLISIATTSRASRRPGPPRPSPRSDKSTVSILREGSRLDAGEHPEAERAIAVDVIRL